MASSTGGRFLPGDPRVSEPYRLTPQLAFRVAVLAFLTLGVFAVLFLRLWALQVLSGNTYLTQANDNRVRTLRIEAPRGVILDNTGKVLVTNVAGTRVELWPADLPKKWPTERNELRALSNVTGVSVATMLANLEKSKDDPVTPIVVQRGLKQNQILYLEENQAQFPGVRLQQTPLRRYPYQSLAAQVLGYVGAISPAEYATLKKKGYQPTDQIGQTGIEYAYDTYLRGKDGTAQLTVDSLGRPKGVAVPVTQPTPGDALQLTINAKPAARGAEGDRLRDRPRAPDDGREVRRRRLDRRDGPEHRRHPRDGVEPDLSAVDLLRPHERQEAAAGPGLARRAAVQPRDRGELSARLDVQAGHRARGDDGAGEGRHRPAAVAGRGAAVLAAGHRSTSRCSRTGPT